MHSTPPERGLTVGEACTVFLAQFEASPARVRLARAMLAKAVGAFGDEVVATLAPGAIAAWRADMPPPTRWQATQAIAQVTRWAQRNGLVDRDPFAFVRNPRPAVEEVRPLASWAQVEALASAMPAHATLLPVLGAGGGLRPGELLGLQWPAVDLAARQVRVVASLDDRGRVQRALKTRRSRRAVPLRQRVVDHLERVPVGERTGFVVRGPGGGVADLRNLRRRAWRPALLAAGIEHPHRIYDLRHTYATWALRAGVAIFQLARRMGTSVDMIELTYGHLAADAAEHELALLDAWDDATDPTTSR